MVVMLLTICYKYLEEKNVYSSGTLLLKLNQTNKWTRWSSFVFEGNQTCRTSQVLRGKRLVVECKYNFKIGDLLEGGDFFGTEKINVLKSSFMKVYMR